MINRLMHVLAVLFAAVTFSFVAYAQQPQSQARFAFVIGNDSYEGAELPTAANDAALVAEMLKAAGFDVTGARNLDQETLRASYREFLEKVAAGGPDSVAFVYVSGYGMQSDGENFFIPPGARVARAADLALNGVRLADITRSLGGLPAQARIMVFDLAYASPFAREGQASPPGLAIMDAGPGDLVAFNAAPGAVAPMGQPPYGAFAQALAEMARVPGTPISDVFNSVRVRVAEMTKGAQVPWRESRIAAPVVLFARGANAPAPAVSQADMAARRARPLSDMSEAEAYALALDRDTIRGYEEFLAAFPRSAYARNVRNIIAARREAVTWRRTVQVNTPAAYWSYLDRYPKGPNSAAARARLARMQAALDPPPRYDVIEYDVAPPPPDESAYFVNEGPGYFASVDAPIEVEYIAPAPNWWRPPPPPVYVEDSHYFLPMPDVVEAPAWIAPPVYVVAPPQPIIVLPPEPGYRINPYVAAPVALAAGIAAGSIIYRRDRLARPGVGPARPFLPPVAMPPRGRPLPAALQQQNLQNFQQRPRPVNNGQVQGSPFVGTGGQPGVRPGQQLPNQPGLRPGQPGFQPGQQGFQPGQGVRPGQQGFQPGQQGLMPGQQQGVQRPMSPQERQRQIQMERQQQLQMQRQQQMQMQQQRQQQQREQQMQRQQQLRDQQQQRQQQMQMQRQQQLQQQQGRQQQLQQQREQQLQRQQQMQQQRQQQLQQQQGRQQQLQQQREQQMQRQQQMQQQRNQQMQQQQQRQQQMQMQQQRQQQMQQQRQQQMQVQQQRQQQMQMQQQRQQQMQQQRQQQMQMQQQRQQQMQMQQQRQQQMQQQRQQIQQQRQQRRDCRPGQPGC